MTAMVKPDDLRLVVRSDVHARATVVFSTKGNARRYIGPDYTDRYVNGKVKDVVYKKNKKGTLLSYPVILFHYVGIQPKEVTLALAQVKVGRAKGSGPDKKLAPGNFPKIVGEEGVCQTKVNKVRKVSPEKRKELLLRAGQSLAVGTAKFNRKKPPPASKEQLPWCLKTEPWADAGPPKV